MSYNATKMHATRMHVDLPANPSIRTQAHANRAMPKSLRAAIFASKAQQQLQYHDRMKTHAGIKMGKMGKKWLKNISPSSLFGFGGGDDSSQTNLAPREEYEEEDDFLNPFGGSTRRDPRHSKRTYHSSTKSAESSVSTNSGDTTSVCGNLTGLWYDNDYDDGLGGGGAYDDVSLRDDHITCGCNTRRQYRRRRRNVCLLVSAVLAIAGSAGFVALVAVQRKGVDAPFSVSMEGSTGASTGANQQAEEETYSSTTDSSTVQSPSTLRPSASPTNNLATDIQTTADETDQNSCPPGFALFSLDTVNPSMWVSIALGSEIKLSYDFTA